MAGQMVMKIWNQVIMDFREIWMKEILPSSADLKLWWYVCLQQLVYENVVFLVGFSWELLGAGGVDVTDQSLQSARVFTLLLTVIYLCFYLFICFPQFNCSLRQVGNPSSFQDPPNRNITFNMELYNTDLFLVPSQGVFSVAENGHIYVEV